MPVGLAVPTLRDRRRERRADHDHHREDLV